jgi:DNA polymerase iota
MRTEGEFRALQHGGPHPLHGETPSVVDIDDTRWRDPPPPDPNADRRVVAHFDADCFYAQVEELRDPRLASRPVAVTQKYLVVTANYAARKAGVGKLMSVAEAKRLCPDAAFVCGEDLTPYREFSKRIRHVLERFGACEKLGLDECWVDVTNEVDRRLQTRAEDDDDFFDDDEVSSATGSPPRERT